MIEDLDVTFVPVVLSSLHHGTRHRREGNKPKRLQCLILFISLSAVSICSIKPSGEILIVIKR